MSYTRQNSGEELMARGARSGAVACLSTLLAPDTSPPACQTAVYDYCWEEEVYPDNSPASIDKETTTHISIHTLHLDGTAARRCCASKRR
eukprot:m.228303 g.228303  ORF g.228303 m.228303 type:complete len:90 (+) comp10856_c0_seq14:103-372(+)